MMLKTFYHYYGALCGLKRQWIGCWQRPLHQRDAVEAICPPFGLLRKNLLKWWKGNTKFLAGLDKYIHFINLHISVTHRYPVFDTSRQNIWLWPPPYLCYEKSHFERDSVGQRIEDGLRLLMDDRSCQRWRRRRIRVKYLGGNFPRLTWSPNSEVST